MESFGERAISALREIVQHHRNNGNEGLGELIEVYAFLLEEMELEYRRRRAEAAYSLTKALEVS